MLHAQGEDGDVTDGPVDVFMVHVAISLQKACIVEECGVVDVCHLMVYSNKRKKENLKNKSFLLSTETPSAQKSQFIVVHWLI